MHRYLLFVFAFFLFTGQLHAQITPPGLGNTNLSLWTAFGIRQALDTAGRMQSVTYAGFGQISSPDNYNPVEKSGIFILNEEFYHQFSEHLQYSVALSYRQQNEYLDTIPYSAAEPAKRQEFRMYTRFSLIDNNRRSRFTCTFRQEFRKFYTPDFSHPDETCQLRSRLRLQYVLFLDTDKIHRLALSAEALFAISRNISPVAHWTEFNYRESRLSVYYSFNPASVPFVFNMGYMNNLVGGKTIHPGHYVALDVIWQNPFGLLQKDEQAGGMQ